MALEVYFGEIQSGHLEQVGYDTYCNLLDEVIKEMKGIKWEEEEEVQIDLDVTSYIPDEYIPDSNQKIEIYQNIALCANEKDIQNVIDEVIDRFGNMPQELENLIDIARIKYLSKQIHIEKISTNGTFIVFTFNPNTLKEPINIQKLVNQYGNKIKFSAGIKPKITLDVKEKNEKKLLKDATEFIKYLLKNKNIEHKENN